MNWGGWAMKWAPSLFSRALIKNNIKRFWWISAFYFAMLFFVNVLPVYFADTEREYGVIKTLLEFTNYQNEYIIYLLVVFFIFPIAAGVLLFRYMQSERLAGLVHSLPCKRSTIFGSNMLSGTAIIGVPCILISVILIILSLFTSNPGIFSVLFVVKWLGKTLLFTFSLYTITVFAGMLTGNSIVHFVLAYVVNLLSLGLFGLILFNLEGLVNGYYITTPGKWIQLIPLYKIFFLSELTLFEVIMHIIIAAAVAAVSLYIYNRRHIENAGNITGFKAMKQIYKYSAVVFAMLITGTIIAKKCSFKVLPLIAGYIISSILVYFIAEGIIKKTFRVWKEYRGYLIVAGITAVLIACAVFDVTGYRRYVPDENEVEYVYLGEYRYMDTFISRQKEDRKIDSMQGRILREPYNIKSIIDAHKELSQSIDRFPGSKGIAYVLKDGSLVKRKYGLNHWHKELFEPVFNSIEYKKSRYPFLSKGLDSIGQVEIWDGRVNKSNLTLRGEEKDGFMKALKTDVLNRTTEDNDMNFFFRMPGISVFSEGREGSEWWYKLDNTYQNSISWLKGKGYYKEYFVQPEEIEEVSVQCAEVRFTENFTELSLKTKSTVALISSPDLVKRLLQVYRTDKCNMDYEKQIYRLVFSVKNNKNDGGKRYFYGYIYGDDPIAEKILQ